MTLLARVVATIKAAEIRFAVVGATALPTVGVSRSTLDFDLLTTNPRGLEPSTWEPLREAGVEVDVRQGDALDPLLGVVRFAQTDQLNVDLVVGKHRWQTRALERARELPSSGLTLPVVRGEDLLLLKLFAGGPQDAWDVKQALAGPQRAQLIAAVERDLGDLPARARRLWKQVLEASPAA